MTSPTLITQSSIFSIDTKPIQEILNKKKSLAVLTKNINGREAKELKAINHLTHYIVIFNNSVSQQIPVLNSVCLLSLKKWSTLVQFCNKLGSSVFSNKGSSEENNKYFLDEGICVGYIVDYISKFFDKKSPLEVSPYPLKETPYTHSLVQNIKFYSFNVSNILDNNLQHLRFLQASYKISQNRKSKESLEFLPDKILNKKKIKIVNRFPNLPSNKIAYNIDDLLPELKKHSDKKNTCYLIGIGKHGIALYLQEPYHFIDPTNGIAMAGKQEDLMLFLAVFLREKYPDRQSFALIEFIQDSSK